MATNTTEGPRSFARFLEGLGDGDAVRDTSEALFKLTNVLQNESLARGDKVVGELVLKLRMSCDPRGNVGIAYDVDIKEPKRKRVTAVAWVTKGGNITFEHPRQTKLALREVSRNEQVIDADTGEVHPPREV